MLNTWEGVRTGPGSSQVLNNMSVTMSVPPGQHTRTPTHIQTHHMHTQPTCTYIHTSTHTYTHTRTDTPHAYTQPTCTHTRTSTHTHTNHTYPYMCTHIKTSTHNPLYTYTYKHTYKPHIPIHMRTQDKHTHTRLGSDAVSQPQRLSSENSWTVSEDSDHETPEVRGR